MREHLKTFCYEASNRILTGLCQELKLVPDRHYRPSAHNASRVLSLRLVNINPAYLPKIKTMEKQLAYWAGLSNEYQVRVGHDHFSVIIEIPKPKTFWAQVTIEQMEQRRFIKKGPIATLGLGLQDEPRRIDFSEPAMAHIFVTGQTRSGKTNTQKLIAWNLARNLEPDNSKMLIVDVAKRGFHWDAFSNVQNLAHPVVTDINESDRVLCWLTNEIERRVTQRQTEPRVFIFIDELKALVDDSKVASDYLARIASIGGEFGLHLILSTQYPQIKMLGSAEIKRNVTTRLCGRVDGADAAANALGLPGTGAESLGGYGDFLLKANSLSRLTVAKIEDHHIRSLARAGEQDILDLPAADDVNDGPKTRQHDSPEPEQVALALFEPMAINKLQKALGIGGKKATRVKAYAESIRQWALTNGHNCLQNYSIPLEKGYSDHSGNGIELN